MKYGQWLHANVHGLGGQLLKRMSFMDRVLSSKKTFIGGYFNGHAGSEAGGFGEVHDDYGIGQSNDMGVRLMD